MNFSHLFQYEKDPIQYSAGDTIIARGETSRTFYVILEGEAEIHYKGQTLADAGPGEVFGELSLIDDEPTSADVVALTDISVTAVDEKLMSERLRRMNDIS